jgi:hypothetical protein
MKVLTLGKKESKLFEDCNIGRLFHHNNELCFPIGKTREMYDIYSVDSASHFQLDKSDVNARFGGISDANVRQADDPSDLEYLPFLGKLVVLETISDWPGIIVPPYFKPDIVLDKVTI